MNKFIQISIFFLWLVADAFGTKFAFDEFLAIPASKTLSPTLLPKQSNPAERAAILIHNSLHSGNDAAAIITRKKYAQRLEIMAKYEEKYNESLLADLVEAYHRDEYRCFFEALLTPRKYVADLLYHVLSYPETMGTMPITMLSTMPSNEKREVIAAFNTHYGSLKTKIDEAVTDERYKALLLKLVETERSESESTDIEQAVVDAAAFKTAVDYRFGTNDTSIIDEILCKRSIAQLKLTTTVFNFDLLFYPQNALLYSLIDTPEYYADVLEDARANMDYCIVSWVLALRSEIDMGPIIKAYDKKYAGKTVYNLEVAISMDDFYKDVVSLLIIDHYDYN